MDNISTYLALRPITAETLFGAFYGQNADLFCRKWQRGELVPDRLNNWCGLQVQDIQIDRRGKQPC